MGLSEEKLETENINKEIDNYISSRATANTSSLTDIKLCNFKKPILVLIEAIISVGLSKIPDIPIVLPRDKIEKKLNKAAKDYLDERCP